MRQSELFTRTRKNAPTDEVAKNAELLIRAGYVHKEMAGVYSYLPLGLRVLNKIISVIREEMHVIGGQEVFLSALQDKSIWEKTNRWSDDTVDIWFKTKLKSGSDLGLGFTHEEALTNAMRDHIQSFRDLPRAVFQFQTKFRNETRAKSGIMRSREFIMKDLYSFSRDEKEHAIFYEKASHAYRTIFNRLGIGEKTFKTYASGGSFSKYSHEFQTVTSAGEDTIHICDDCKLAINDEIFGEQNTCPECGEKKFRTETAVEVGNIFTLGTRFADALDLTFTSEAGERKSVFMGSYGIGPARVMGTIVELLSDEKGIVWPASVAPFTVHLISLAGANKDVEKAGDTLYKKLLEKGIEVLYDDRELRAGEKFADSDLLGLPYRIIISEKTMSAGKLEIKKRTDAKAELIDEARVITTLTELQK